MSGHKKTTVTLSQEEYRRLFEAEQRLLYGTLAQPEDTIIPAIQTYQNRVSDEMETFGRRQHAFGRVISQLSNEMQDLERSTQEQLIHQQESLFSRFLEISENAQIQMDDSFQTLFDDLNSRLQQSQDSLRQDFFRQENRILSLEQTFRSQEERAETLFRDLFTLLDHLGATFPLSPEGSPLEAELFSMIPLVENNLEAGDWPSAVSSCQHAISIASALRIQKEQEANLYQLNRNLARMELSKLAQRINAVEVIPIIDLEGNPLDQSLRLDEWTQNGWSLLNDEVIKMIDSLDQDAIGSSADLRNLITERIPELNQKLDELVVETFRLAMDAQTRFNIANQVMLALVRQGFTPVAGSFENRNFLNQYFAKARDFKGSTVEIRVEPTEILQKAELHVLSSDTQDHSEHEMRQRGKEIFQDLMDQGFSLSKPSILRSRKQIPSRIPIQN